MIWLFIVLIIVIFLWETPNLIKEKAYNELIAFSIFMLVGVYMGMVWLFDLPFISIMSELAIMLQYR